MLKPFIFAKSLSYPPNSRAKPPALYLDPLVLNAVFQFETLFVILFWIVTAASQWSWKGAKNSQRAKQKYLGQPVFFVATFLKFGQPCTKIMRAALFPATLF